MAKKRAKTAREANAIATLLPRQWKRPRLLLRYQRTILSPQRRQRLQRHWSDCSTVLRRAAWSVSMPMSPPPPVGSNTSSTSSVGGGCQPLTEDENLYLCNNEVGFLGDNVAEEKYELITQFKTNYPMSVRRSITRVLQRLASLPIPKCACYYCCGTSTTRLVILQSVFSTLQR